MAQQKLNQRVKAVKRAIFKHVNPTGYNQYQRVKRLMAAPGRRKAEGGVRGVASETATALNNTSSTQRRRRTSFEMLRDQIPVTITMNRLRIPQQSQVNLPSTPLHSQQQVLYSNIGASRNFA